MYYAYLDEMAARLRINPATLQYWASRQLVPATKDARGRYRFEESEVLRVVADWPPTPPTNIRRRIMITGRGLDPLPVGRPSATITDQRAAAITLDQRMPGLDRRGRAHE